jgi:hypothetical protein
MKKRSMLAAAMGVALALLVPAAEAGAAPPRNTAFAGNVIPPGFDIFCHGGARTGEATGPVKIRVGTGSGGNTANATSVVASWPGGSFRMSRFNHTYTLSSKTKFNCPAAGPASTMTVTFQPFRGSRRVGDADTETVAVKRVDVQLFAAAASLGEINVNCQTNDTSGRSATRLRLKATHNTSGVNPTLLGDDQRIATRLVASWPGGSVTIGRFESFYTASSRVTFPCPVRTTPGSGTLTVSIQPYRGSAQVGSPAKVLVKLNRVGSPS